MPAPGLSELIFITQYNHANAARSVRPPAADNFDESSEEEEDDDDEDNADIRGPMVNSLTFDLCVTFGLGILTNCHSL